MRYGRVGELTFSNAVFDERIFEVLLPLKDAWSDGTVWSPDRFASLALFERAFSELFLCKSMVVDTLVHGQLSRPFLSLPAVRGCTWPSVFRFPVQLSVAEIVEWINADAPSNDPRWLEVSDEALDDSVDDLVQHLKTDFVESTRTLRYGVTIRVDAYDGPRERFVNKGTSEMLTIDFDDFVHALEVERKPMDDE